MTGLATKRVVLLTAAIDDETFSPPVNVEGYTHIVVYAIANGTVSSGKVRINEATVDPATNQPYAGTWVQVGTDLTPASGTIVALHLTVAAYSLLQARIETVIGGGGSVTVVMVASE